MSFFKKKPVSPLQANVDGIYPPPLAGLPAPPPMFFTAKLRCQETGSLILVHKEYFRIGRGENGSDYVISDDRSVSRTHAAVITNDHTHSLIDLDSRNGTYLNHTRIPPNREVPLHNGDIIRIGNTEFQFLE